MPYWKGLPTRLGLPAGQTHDGQIGDTLLDHLGPHIILLADKAHDSDRIRELIQDQGATSNIPPESNRRWKPCFSQRLYRERELIARFFAKLKHFRRVATRYEKLAPTSSPWSNSPQRGCGLGLSLRPESICYAATAFGCAILCREFGYDLARDQFKALPGKFRVDTADQRIDSDMAPKVALLPAIG